MKRFNIALIILLLIIIVCKVEVVNLYLAFQILNVLISLRRKE